MKNVYVKLMRVNRRILLDPNTQPIWQNIFRIESVWSENVDQFVDQSSINRRMLVDVWSTIGRRIKSVDDAL